MTLPIEELDMSLYPLTARLEVAYTMAPNDVDKASIREAIDLIKQYEYPERDEDIARIKDSIRKWDRGTLVVKSMLRLTGLK